MASGRKTLKEELTVLRRYNDLMPKYFKVITEHLESEEKEDRQWAVERLDKAFAKMLPEKIDLEGKLNHTVDVPDSIYRAIVKREANNLNESRTE